MYPMGLVMCMLLFCVLVVKGRPALLAWGSCDLRLHLSHVPTVQPASPEQRQGNEEIERRYPLIRSHRLSRSLPPSVHIRKPAVLPPLPTRTPPPQVRTCELAAEWRQRWKGDVVVDLVCYR